MTDQIDQKKRQRKVLQHLADALAQAAEADVSFRLGTGSRDGYSLLSAARQVLDSQPAVLQSTDFRAVRVEKGLKLEVDVVNIGDQPVEAFLLLTDYSKNVVGTPVKGLKLGESESATYTFWVLEENLLDEAEGLRVYVYTGLTDEYIVAKYQLSLLNAPIEGNKPADVVYDF
jgi:hypothetical protein